MFCLHKLLFVSGRVCVCESVYCPWWPRTILSVHEDITHHQIQFKIYIQVNPITMRQVIGRFDIAQIMAVRWVRRNVKTMNWLECVLWYEWSFCVRKCVNWLSYLCDFTMNAKRLIAIFFDYECFNASIGRTVLNGHCFTFRVSCDFLVFRWLPHWIDAPK